ncbi:MAG: hypothetical protein Q4C75_08110, partial [Bergeyella zoohelcum]|nr:hypothetical protein [Bergeyella zoohelcum]
KTFELNNFSFSENNYEISGNGISIIAEDGNFKETQAHCLNGIFPSIKIILNDKEINLKNISIKDCSVY